MADLYNGYVEALEALGQQVSRFNLDSRLTLWTRAMVETGQVDGNVVGLRRAVDDKTAIYLASEGVLSAAYKCLPDVVLVISCMFISTETLDILRARGHKVVLVHTESPYDDDNQMELAAHADLSLVNDPTNLEQFRAIAPTEYFPHCYRPTVHYPGPPSAGMASDFCFVGTAFPTRVEFLEAMDLDHSGLSILLAGQWQMLAEDSPLQKWIAHDVREGVDNEQTAQIYRSAKTSLNFYRREAARPELVEGWSMGPREVEMSACGLWYARDPRPEGDELLPLPTFTSPEEAADLIGWFVDHDGPRQAMADAAREVVQDRTFHNAARRLLTLLDRYGPERDKL